MSYVADESSPPPRRFPLTVHQPSMSTHAAQQVIITSMLPLGPEPARITCPHCFSIIKTRIDKSPNAKAYIIGTLIFCLGGVLGCCLIPCCLNSCLDTKHTCPKCEVFVGEHKC